jgi:5'-nucleotidase
MPADARVLRSCRWTTQPAKDSAVTRLRVLGLLAGASLSLGCAGSAPAAAPATPPATPPVVAAAPLTVELFAFNDFHGHLEPPAETWTTTAGPVRVGGAAYLAAHLEAVRAEHPGTIVLSAGDLVGASPLASALLHDEPTIEVMNTLGLDLNAVGNHEFDEGTSELLRLMRGGCHATDGCRGTTPWTGARFATLAANVTADGAAAPLFPPVWRREVGGAEVAFIGLGLASTAAHQPPGFGGVRFENEADSANALVPGLRASGVEALVVVVHEGLLQDGGPNACASPRGDLVRLVERLDPAIDLVVSGHTHQAYVCRIAGRTVTSAGSYGRLYTRATLTLDPRTRDVVEVRAHNHLVTHDRAPEPRVAAVVERWVLAARALGDRTVGRITADLSKINSPGGDSPLGRVVADAQLAATRSQGAVAALMHERGLRSALGYAPGDREPAPGLVSFAEVAAVHPFENRLVTLTLLGRDLLAFLDSGYAGDEEPRRYIPSASLRWSWSARARRVVPESLRLDGQRVEPERRYRITVNDYLAGRGVLTRATDEVRTVTDRDALVAYFEAQGTVSPPAEARVTRVE